MINFLQAATTVATTEAAEQVQTQTQAQAPVEQPAQQAMTTTQTTRQAPVTEPQPTWIQDNMMFIMLGLMVLVLWFFMWRPESKRRKQMAEFRAGLKKGDKVVTAGGIFGVVKEVKETSLLIEVDGDVTLRVDKNMVVADQTAAK